LKPEFFIARRIIGSKDNALSFSRPVVWIAVISVMLSLSIMILAVSIVRGFKNQITGKLVGISSHITITNLDNNYSFETRPVYKYEKFYDELRKVRGIRHIQSYALKHAILKTQDEIQGVVIKGIDHDFDWNFFSEHLVEGNSLQVGSDTAASREIVISKVIADRLQIRANDTIYTYYLNQPVLHSAGRLARIQKLALYWSVILPYDGEGFISAFDYFPSTKPLAEYYDSISRDIVPPGRPSAMKLRVAGIYETGMYELDEQLMLADVRLVQDMYGWTRNDVTGFELMTDDYRNLDALTDTVIVHVPGGIYVSNIRENYPAIFVWLPSVDVNSVIIIVLMILVSIMAMISTLLILILEKTSTIGILKALGMANWNVQQIFLYHAAHIVTRGMILGNLLGIGMCLVQLYLKPVKLPKESYYLTEVPIEMFAPTIILINVSTFVVCLLALLLPSLLVTRISPVKAIRMD